MLLVEIDELETDMELAAPIAHPRTGEHTLLNTGYVLSSRVILRLKGMGVTSAWIHHPGLNFLDRHLGSAIPKSRSKILHTVKDSFTKLSKKVATRIPVSDYLNTVNDLILALLAFPDNAVYSERLAGGGHELFSHSSNVAYLSMVVSMSIRGYIRDQRARLTAEHAREVTNLGVGAMMHDLGKLSLPEPMRTLHIVDPEASSSDDYRRHVQAGFKLAQWRVEPSAAQVLLHHHQRYDGTGFPQVIHRHGRRKLPPLAGTGIHIFSRIVAVANTYDSLLGDGQRMSAVEALYRLNSPEYAGWFDPVVLRSFLSIIPPYPLGNMVSLSDGRRAVIIGLNGEHPCQPIVRLLDTPDPVDLNLMYHPELCIQTHQGRRVDQFFFDLPTRNEMLAAQQNSKTPYSWSS